MKVWLDGVYVPDGEAAVPLLSHAFSRGMAIFEALKIVATVDGPALFALPEHVDRFFGSAELMGLPLGLSKAELIEVVRETARVNRVTAGAAKFYAYYPEKTWGIRPHGKKAAVAVFCGDHAEFGIDPARRGRPLTLGVSTYCRLHPQSVPIKAKVTGYYVGAYLSALEAAAGGFDEAVMVDTDGWVCEGGASSNFFVKDGVLLTPPLEKVLAGTTRAVVLEVAASLGIETREADIQAGELTGFDEAFLTGSVLTLAPVLSIDGVKLGRDCPGPVTARLMEAMNRVYRGEWAEYRKLLTFF